MESIADRSRRSRFAATLALVALSYFVFASAATFPVVLTFGSELPGQLTDPLEHLWLMRWSQTCLTNGQSPFFSPALNAPTGVPLGYFPTMHVQTLAYLLMGLVTDNDVARFNVLWFSGFVATGLGTFLLAWWVVRRVGPAWLAGLGAMLCGPMLMHAHGHLETMQMGAVPLFVVGWIRFVDSPGWIRLLAAVGLYLLVVACAPYFAVLAVFPAVWYVAWSVFSAKSGSRRTWVWSRSGWLAGFGAMVLPGLALLFSSQVWAAQHGYSMARTRLQFDQFGAPLWSSFVPSPLHALGKFVTPDLFAATGYSSRMSECSSYLGIVTLALLAYAAMARLRFPRAGYWWSVLALMMVLSWGSRLELGLMKISLPAGWIYGIFPPFHLIRVPARFNLFAAVCAAVPASVALADLMGRIARPTLRVIYATGCAGLMLADLSMVPFETSIIPPMPATYRDLSYRNPDASLVDAPMFGSNEGQVFSSLWGYWQSIHHARTTAGYPGLPNVPFESEIVRPSPFWAARLLDPTYLADRHPERFGPVEGVDPRDYAWLFLTAHQFHHIILHQGTWTDPKYACGSARLKDMLAEAKVFEDADVAVFGRELLHIPKSLTWLCGEGFRPRLARDDSWSFGVLRQARIAVYNPTPERSMVLALVDASAFKSHRVVRLIEGDREIAHWKVEPNAPRTIETPPFKLGDGVCELSLISDGDDRPARYVDRLDDARTPYSLRINSLRVRLETEQ
jgi:hypothetical protein